MRHQGNLESHLTGDQQNVVYPGECHVSPLRKPRDISFQSLKKKSILLEKSHFLQSMPFKKYDFFLCVCGGGGLIVIIFIVV